MFWGVSALVFAASAAATIVWCAAMAGGMAEMPMPGGWTMSMAWMRMPGQSWLGAAASFMGMWLVMMVAMMLPSLAGMLMSYRRSPHRLGRARLWATMLAGAGYFAVWMLVGAAVYPLGIALAAVINLLNVELIVMGGGVMEAGDLILKPTVKETRRRAFPPSFNSCEMVIAKLGSAACLIGAALLARDR